MKDIFEIVTTDLYSQIDNEILQACIKVGVNVDKEELIKLLNGDRDSYRQGFFDGVMAFAKFVNEDEWYPSVGLGAPYNFLKMKGYYQDEEI
jgi:hypothetical protein